MLQLPNTEKIGHIIYFQSYSCHCDNKSAVDGGLSVKPGLDSGERMCTILVNRLED